MRKSIVLDTAGVLLGSIVLLAIAGQFASLRRWHVNGWWDVLNDQVGYISVGRNLANRGNLDSNIIYTSTLKQKATRNYLYMPGHYLTLALSFAVLGVGPLQSVIPSLLSYCLATCCVFLTARRLYGRTAGFLAVGLFALFPAVLGMAFTAMAELTLLAAVSLAVCLFVYLPEKLRPWAGPLLLALPFIFRETTALLVIPMAALVLGGIPLLQRIPWARWRALAIFCLLSVGLLACIFRSPISAGRPSLIKLNVFSAGEWDVYHDVTIWDHVPAKPGLSAWAKAIRKNIEKNIQRLPDVRDTRPPGLELASLAAIGAGILLAIALGAGQRDGLVLSCGIMGLAASILLLSLYFTSGFRGLRILIFLWPLLAIAIAAGLVRLHLPRGIAWSLGSLGIVLAAGGFALGCRAIHQIKGNDPFDDSMLALLKTVQPNPRRVLASPYKVGLNYVLRYPAGKWAFLPTNAPTLAVLAKKYDVGTVIIPEGSTALIPADLRKAGFVLVQNLEWNGQKITVYKGRAKSIRRRPATRPAF